MAMYCVAPWLTGALSLWIARSAFSPVADPNQAGPTNDPKVLAGYQGANKGAAEQPHHLWALGSSRLVLTPACCCCCFVDVRRRRSQPMGGASWDERAVGEAGS